MANNDIFTINTRYGHYYNNDENGKVIFYFSVSPKIYNLILLCNKIGLISEKTNNIVYLTANMSSLNNHLAFNNVHNTPQIFILIVPASFPYELRFLDYIKCTFYKFSMIERLKLSDRYYLIDKEHNKELSPSDE